VFRLSKAREVCGGGSAPVCKGRLESVEGEGGSAQVGSVGAGHTGMDEHTQGAGDPPPPTRCCVGTAGRRL
jgi:hypothetical protein